MDKPGHTVELNPVARELAPAGLRSGPKIFAVSIDFVSAAHSSGSKLPRHGQCWDQVTLWRIWNCACDQVC
ncbi:hypothetical protein C1884_21590 [Pseudomonas sp. GW460-R15]|nr:hypothetical protein C1887_23540 [Pseudomonas sp. GW456-R21]POA64286.1 hypothetical protein C1884_21590 [Pseudomonas sp. GW460-R15]